MEDLSEKFRGMFGYPQLPTQELLEQQQQERANAQAQQAKQARLREQMSQAVALRDTPTKGGSILSALGSLGQFAGGDANVRRTQGRQESNDNALAQSMAAAQEAEVQKGQRGEQRSLAESMQAYTTNLKDRESRENISLARSRDAALNRQSSAAKPHAFKAQDIQNYEKGDHVISVERNVNPNTGRSTYSYYDAAGDWQDAIDRPPAGYKINKEVDKIAGRVAVENVKSKSRMAEASQDYGFDIGKIAAKTAGQLTVLDKKQLGAGAFAILEEGIEMRAVAQKLLNDESLLGTKAFHAEALQSLKSGAAWDEMVFEIGADKAAAAVEGALELQLARARIASQEKISGEVLSQKEKQFEMSLTQDESQDLRKYQEAAIAAETKLNADQSQINLKDFQLRSREASDREHELIMQKNKLEASAQEAAIKASGEGGLDRNQTAGALRNFQKDNASLERLSGHYNALIEAIQDDVGAGLNIEGIGQGDYFVHSDIQMQLSQALQLQATANTRGDDITSTVNDAGGSKSQTTAVRRGGGNDPSRKSAASEPTITDTESATQTQGERVIDGGRAGAGIAGRAVTGDRSNIEVTIDQDAIGATMLAGNVKAQKINALMSQLIGAVAQDRSGLEVPNAEYQRIARELGMGNLTDDKAIVELLNHLGVMINQRTDQAKAGALSEIKELYFGENPNSALQKTYQPMVYGGRTESGEAPPTKEVPKYLKSSSEAALALMANQQDPRIGSTDPDSPIPQDDINTRTLAEHILGGNGFQRGEKNVEQMWATAVETKDGVVNAIKEALSTDFQVMENNPVYGEHWKSFMEDELAQIDAGDGSDIDKFMKEKGWWSRRVDWLKGDNKADQRMEARVLLAKDRAIAQMAGFIEDDVKYQMGSSNQILPQSIKASGGR